MTKRVVGGPLLHGRAEAGDVPCDRSGGRRPGDRARIAFFRRDLLMEATLTLVESPDRKWTFEPDRKAPAAARAVRARWLGVRASAGR